MTTNQQQVAALLKDVLNKGLDTNDAIPTMKKLIQAKIFSLQDLSAANMPPGIDAKIQSKLLPRKRSVNSPYKSSPTKRPRLVTILPPSVTSRPSEILVNRSPVLTLWATVVAQKIYPELSLTEALTFGSATAARTARSKGTKLGIYSKEKDEARAEAFSSDKDATEEKTYSLLGFHIDALQTPEGIRALANGGQIQNPQKTWSHLKKRFGDGLGYILQEMHCAADAAGVHLKSSAYDYYVHIRPDIPQGTKGWGAHGVLETSKLSNFYPTTSRADLVEQGERQE